VLRTAADLAGSRAVRVALDTGVAVLFTAVCVRSVIPRRFLLELGWGAELGTVVVAALALLAGRIAIASRSGDRAGLALGAWFGGLRAPALVLAAAFALVVAFRPPFASPMGADEAPHVRQLAAFYLEGRLTEAGLEPGPTLLWGPFYLLAHAVTLALRALGFDIGADGWSEPYRNAVRLGSAACALAAAAFAWSVCRRFFPPFLAAVSVTAFWLGSPLLHYSWAEPAMAHAPAAALTSLLVWLWLRLRDGRAGVWTWTATGIVAGLLVSTQRYDVYFLLLPLSEAARAVFGRTGRVAAAARGRAVTAAVIAGVLAVVPLLVVALRSADALLVSPTAVGRVFLTEWRHPHVAEVLFASNGGLFAWTPLALAGVLGLVGLARSQPRTAVHLLAAVGLGVLLLASNAEWWGGWSFGARRLTEAFPAFALGLCAAVHWLLRRPAVLVAAALAGLVALNVSWSRLVRSGEIPQGDAVSFSAAGAAALENLHESLGHPFAWPGPWLFAWRYDVLPGRFDTLFGRVPRSSWDVRIGTREDLAVVGRGWSPPVEDERGAAFRWALGSVSTLLVTLTAPESRVVVFGATGVVSPAGWRQHLRLHVNGELVRAFELPTSPMEQMIVVPVAFWRGGLNEIALRSEWQLGTVEARAIGEAPDSAFRLWEFQVRPAAATND
jgi:hypothetical protein